MPKEIYIVDDSGTVIAAEDCQWVEITVRRGENFDKTEERLNDGQWKRFDILRGAMRHPKSWYFIQGADKPTKRGSWTTCQATNEAEALTLGKAKMEPCTHYRAIYLEPVSSADLDRFWTSKESKESERWLNEIFDGDAP
jgi:hypothetical protein